MGDFGEVAAAFAARLMAAAPAATFKAAEHLREVAVNRAPIETGNLRASAEVRPIDDGAEVRFPGPYARRQEFELSWHHEVGQALYLTSSVLSEKRACIDIMAAELRKAAE